METFGKLVKQQRKALGLTQMELARLVACSPETIKKIEADERRPSRQIAELLARHLALGAAQTATFLRLARLGTALESDLESDLALASPRAPLPTAAIPLLGRQAEVQAVSALLMHPEVRLVTLTGVGGTGKTRLSLHVAEALQPQFAHGMVFVNLAPITDPELVFAAMAHEFGLREVLNQSLQGALLSYLSNKQLLLLLDNFEQVLPAASHVAKLLTVAPGLKVLATSRATLQIAGEREFVVPPLPVPSLSPAPDLGELARNPAISLFIQRAQRLKPDFALTPTNAPSIAEICVRLQGLPLAIELAAAHSKLLTPLTLLQRLHTSMLDILASHLPDLPERHQSMRQMIAWSYDLLVPEGQRLFQQLGLFVGGASLEAVVRVQTHPESLEVLLARLEVLLEHNLIQTAEDASGETRFTLLEPLREFAQDCLARTGQLVVLQQTYSQFYVDLAEQAEAGLQGPQLEHWLMRLDAEHGNLQTALSWSCAKGGPHELALRLGSALWQFWLARGYTYEGRTKLTHILAQPFAQTPSVWRARLLNGAGLLTWAQGDAAPARALLEESVALFKQFGDEYGYAWALNHLGQVARLQGDQALAMNCFTESQALFRRLGKPWNTAWAVANLGEAMLTAGETDRAAQLHQESLALFQQTGDQRGNAWALYHLGQVAQAQKKYTEAAAFFIQSLDRFRAIGSQGGTAWAFHYLACVRVAQHQTETALSLFLDSLRLHRAVGDKWGVAWNMVRLAEMTYATGRFERAATLLGTAESFFSAMSGQMLPTDRVYVQEQINKVRTQLTPEAFATAWAAGLALTHDQAFALTMDK